MTPRQVALVQDSWNRIHPIHREMMGQLGTAVACLGRFHELAPGMQDFGGRYATYPLGDSHDDAAAQAFLGSLELALDTDFTPEMKHAWSMAYPMLSNVMKDAANDPAFTQAVA